MSSTQYNSLEYSLLNLYQGVLQERLSLNPEPESTIGGINPSAIVIRKLLPPDPDKSPHMSEETLPGILITPGNRALHPDAGNENQRDAIAYPAMIQIIANDWDKDLNLPTYQWWQELIWKSLSHYLAENPFILGDRCAYDTVAQMSSSIDQKMYVRHQLFVCGVEVLSFARMTRGVPA